MQIYNQEVETKLNEILETIVNFKKVLKETRNKDHKQILNIVIDSLFKSLELVVNTNIEVESTTKQINS